MKGKGNDGTGNNEERDEWRTNQELWNLLNEQYYFSFDCCANETNHKTTYYSNDFLSNTKIDLVTVAWMNPPFSKAKEIFEHFFKVITKGVAIYRCDNMETKVWQEIILEKADWVFIPKGRVNYEGMKGTGSRFPSALIGFNIEPPKNIKGQLLMTKRGIKNE